MYYAGYNGFNYQIGLATSGDKINWTRHADVPVLEYGTPGTWDARYVSQPSVIFENGIYKMWYTGWFGGGLENFKIGYAISANGTNWNKYDFNPVLSASTIGNWDPLGVFSPSVLFHNGIYHMWFTGHDGTKRAIGYATSVDGINWNWYQGNPVLAGNAGSWDKDAVHCDVINFGGNYIMWYTGFNEDTGSIGFAQSSDGINWNKYGGNPVLNVNPNIWEGIAADEPDVFYDSLSFYMWYSGFSDVDHSQIGYAFDITIDVNDFQVVQPEELRLYQNYPNPFNPSTKIRFTIPILPDRPSASPLGEQAGYLGEGNRERLVTLKIYDVLGNEVASLINEELSAGEYEVELKSYQINIFSSGVYYYQLRVANSVRGSKMIYLK
jgi:predicted GH43/DUF377 family glycosyl hydrolase